MSDDLDLVRASAKAAKNGIREEAWVPVEERGKLVVPIFAPPLVFYTLRELHDLVASRPPPRYLAKGVWPEDAYGVESAEMKVGKTFSAADLAVAVASGGSWFGAFPIERPGPVVAFLGEGGDRKMDRRLAAVAEFYGIADYLDLPITVCLRAPHLNDEQHLQIVAAKLDEVRPVLVILDPLYLSVRGAHGSQLYEMGSILEAIQSLCQQAGSALFVSTHHNRGRGEGLSRISGAGPAEWGRVILTGVIKSKRKNEETSESIVVVQFDFVGDEIPDTTLTIRRRVRAIVPGDLASPLVYSVEVIGNELPADSSGTDMPPSHRRVLEVVNTAGAWLNTAQIGDKLADGGHPLKRPTILAATKALVEEGLIDRLVSGGSAFQWHALSEPEGAEDEL